MITIILFLVVFVLLLHFTVSYYRKVARFPKGPFPLPFIGNFREFDFTRQHESFEKFSKDHNGVYTLFAPLPIVIVNTFEAMKEAFMERGDDFNGRPTLEFLDAFTYAHNSGVINSNGEVWREQRRTALSILRDFGMGKNRMEQNVQSSVRDFMEHLDCIEGKTRVKLQRPMQVMIANIINEVLFGFRYSYDECGPIMEYVENFNKMIVDITSNKLYFLVCGLPFLKKVPFIENLVYEKHNRNMNKLRRFVDEQVERCLKDFDQETDEPGCFVQAYMQRALTKKELTPLQLRATCHDFFMAGQETTTTTLRWAILFLAADQRIQDKLRKEVVEIVGHDRMPSMQDRSNMTYAQACVVELQRCANVLSVNIIHETLADTVLQGHPIEKGTITIVDIHGILKRDPVLGGDGDKFRPERYLNHDGKTLKKELVDRTVPFSIGKRACAGEGLARMELFLAITGLVQKYRILPSPDGPIDLSEHSTTAIIAPNDQYIALERI